MEERLGIAAGLYAAFEDEVAGGFEGGGVVILRRHGAVVWVDLILAIHHLGHALHGVHDLVF